MALLRRIKQSAIKFLSNQFLNSYFQIHTLCRASHSYNRAMISNYQTLPITKRQAEFPSNVRFFAAPVQSKSKSEGNDSGPRLNEQITAAIVRLVTEEGHCVLPKQEALTRARNLKLDLVEVQRDAKPPVCKIMDYHREKYQKELKEKDRAKSKSEGTLRNGACKEIRFSGNISQKDLQIKVDMAKRLMERGYRVKCQAKGNKKNGEGEDSAALLSRFLALIEDVAVVESDTRVEDKDQAHIIVRHIKYGPTKKSVKKGSSGNKSVTAKQEEDAEENEQTDWKIDDANDDFDKIFEQDNSGSAMNLGHEKARSTVELPSSSSGVYSGYSSPAPGHNSESRPAPPSTSVGGMGNRYMKDPRNSSHHRSSMEASRYSERNNAQYDANSSTKRRENEYGENQSSTLRNMEHRERAPFSVPGSRTPSYGMFSQVNNATGKQNLPETNRYSQRNPSDTSGHTGRRAGANVSPRF